MADTATSTWAAVTWYDWLYYSTPKTGTRSDYERDYQAYLDTFIRWRFWGGNGADVWALPVWVALDDWEDGIDGYGDNWVWSHARHSRLDQYAGPLDANCYHFGLGSHSLDADGNPVRLVIPIAPEEPPTPVPATAAPPNGNQHHWRRRVRAICRRPRSSGIWRRGQGLCAICGAPSPDRYRCDSCAGKAATYHDWRYQQRRKRGICPRCGRALPKAQEK